MAFWIYFAIFGAMSLATFFTYLADKMKAMNGQWRIKESVLFLLGLLGGSAGALISMGCFRHKIRKWYFWFLNAFFLAVHLALAILLGIYFA